MTRTITAMFGDRSKAQAAASELVRSLGIPSSQVRVHASDASTSATATTTANEGGVSGSLKDILMADEDRYAYAEGIRRGNVVVSANLEEGKLDQAMDLLEDHGAVDLDAQEAEWKQLGWIGYQGGTTNVTTVANSSVAPSMGVAATGIGATTSRASATAMPATAQTGGEEVIPVVEERLQIGKRDAERGRVRVRSYVTETLVSEEVQLREERVSIERRPVNRSPTDADAAFRDRTIEAVEHIEEAVVAKEARVVEELVVRKDATERTETVRDTVRRTEVEVEDTTGAARTTGVSGATNTGSNPPGTAASRAVDKTLGTNISGANPNRR